MLKLNPKISTKLDAPFEFKLNKNLILGCHISGVFDVNRNEILPNDDFSIIEKWANSIRKLNLQAIIFHNNFSERTILQHQSKNLIFVNIHYDIRFKPNVYRYFIYSQFIKKYAKAIDSIFVNDVSDVLVLKNPFVQPLYLENLNAIFCGDEPTTLNNTWMIENGNHLRTKIADYAKIEEQYRSETLLNCGIVGGKIAVIKPFINSLWQIHKKFNFDNETAFTGDMGAFNYIIRKKFNDKLFHGTPINSEFKAYFDNGSNWFQHK